MKATIMLLKANIMLFKTNIMLLKGNIGLMISKATVADSVLVSMLEYQR